LIGDGDIVVCVAVQPTDRQGDGVRPCGEVEMGKEPSGAVPGRSTRWTTNRTSEDPLSSSLLTILAWSHCLISQDVPSRMVMPVRQCSPRPAVRPPPSACISSLSLPIGSCPPLWSLAERVVHGVARRRQCLEINVAAAHAGKRDDAGEAAMCQTTATLSYTRAASEWCARRNPEREGKDEDGRDEEG
jgi:hypothetical protein